MWGVAGLSVGLANSFLELCFLLKSMRERTTPPGCHISRVACAKHPVPSQWALARLPSVSLWWLPLGLQQCLLPSPSFPLHVPVGHCSGSSLQAAPPGQSLTASISLCRSTSALLHRKGKSSSKQRTQKCNFEINTSSV